VSRLTIAAAVAGLAVSVPLASAAEWRQYGFDAARTSDNAAETALGVDNVASVVPAWSSRIGAEPGTSPVVAGGLVFVASGATVNAFDAGSGTALWSQSTCSSPDAAVEPAYARGRLFVGDAGGDLAAYDARTGAMLWCDDEGGSILAPLAVAAGAVYLTNVGAVAAVDQATGAARWRYENDSNGIDGAPAVGGDAVYVTDHAGGVLALRTTDGSPVWQTALDGETVLSGPALAGGRLYVGGTALYALDPADGHVIWRTSRGPGVNVSAPAISGDRLFVNSQDPAFGLFGIDAATGDVLWRRRRSPGESAATPVVANGVVYELSESGKLLFYTLDGGLLGSKQDPRGHPFSETYYAQPAVVNGRIYVSTGDFAGGNRVDAFRLP
jgi:outer membrane protein assembly factor BamB